MFPHHVIVGALSRHPPLNFRLRFVFRMNHVSAVFHSCHALSRRWNLQLNKQGTAKFRGLPCSGRSSKFSCSGHGRLVTICHHAMLRTERERFDQRFVARHGSIAPAPTKKYQAFKKKLSNMCPQVRSTGIGHKTSSFSRPRCLRQSLHCTQEGGPAKSARCVQPAR